MTIDPVLGLLIANGALLGTTVWAMITRADALASLARARVSPAPLPSFSRPTTSAPPVRATEVIPFHARALTLCEPRVQRPWAPGQAELAAQARRAYPRSIG